MPRYIDAEREIKEIESVLDEKRAKGDDENNLGFYALNAFARKLRKAPTADVDPVIRALWIEEERVTKSATRGRTIHSKKLFCSLCGASNGRHRSNYCPRCGAKMDR